MTQYLPGDIYPAIDPRRLHRFFVGQHLRHRVMPLGMIGFLLNGMIVLLKDRMPRLLIAPGLSQKLLAFRTRLIFFCRLKFSDDDLVQLVDGPMRYGFPAHGPIETLILVLDQSTLVPYFYGFDQCFLRVRSFGITNWLVRSLVFNRRPPTLLPVAKSSTIRRKVIPL